MRREHLTILLVDDDPNDLLFIEHAFREAGVTDPIQKVSSGREAIAYLEGRGQFADRSRFEFPCFIITDLKMPNGDGFSVLEALRANPAWAIIPAAILSASEDEDDIKKAYLLGAKVYMSKPGHQQALQELLQKFHEFWAMVHVPRIDAAGEMLPTHGKGKIGERFEHHA